MWLATRRTLGRLTSPDVTARGRSGAEPGSPGSRRLPTLVVTTGTPTTRRDSFDCSIPSMRVVARLRLSRDTDTSTSIERQREVTAKWADMHGHTIVGEAVDLDVSRAVRPIEMPGLRPWLTDPELIDSYDGIVVWRLDRLGAGSIALNEVLAWCRDNGKQLYSATENFDLGSWSGRIVANVLADVADAEVQAIRERTQDSRAKLRQTGRWAGGIPPYGYRSERVDDGYRLVINEEEAEVVREIFRRVGENESCNAIANDLSRRGIRPRKAARWGMSSVRKIAASPWVLGHSVHKGRIVLGDDGMPLQVAEPIISEDEYDAVQAVLADRATPRKRARVAGLLLHVAYCGLCNAPMYKATGTSRGKQYPRYRCAVYSKTRECRNAGVRVEAADDFAVTLFLDEIGDVEVTERVYVPGTDVADELARVTRAIERLRKEADLGLYDDDEDGYLSRLRPLVDRRRELESRPSTPARWETRGTGVTYREAWESMSDLERNRLMVDAGYRVTIVGGKAPVYGAHVPMDVFERAIPGYQSTHGS